MKQKTSGNLYIQYTATPYANLLLTPDDHLAPDFVEILEPGEGYTGGYQFFIQNPHTFRNIGAETSNLIPTKISPNLEKAIANFFVGAALMIGNEGPEFVIPISMLINPHHKNLVQDGYKQILDEQIKTWSILVSNSSEIGALPQVFADERKDLVDGGVKDLSDEEFLVILRACFRNCKVWLMNQSTSGLKIKWEEYGLHILLGANKLDRGFTVEGLTVTYMNRKASDQVDTMQQRSRAYGYRPFINYCRIFTTKDSMQKLKDTVHTEEDLRDQLRNWISLGGNFKDWSREIGLIVKSDSKPNRDSVVKQLTIRQIGGWHFMLNAPEKKAERNFNLEIVAELGLFDAPLIQYGSHRYRTKVVSIDQLKGILSRWQGRDSGTWNSLIIKRYLDGVPKVAPNEQDFSIILIDSEDSGKLRTRSHWFGKYSLKNSGQLLQGSNENYPGDRNLLPESSNMLQIHLVTLVGSDAPTEPIPFLALKIGSNWKSIKRSNS